MLFRRKEERGRLQTERMIFKMNEVKPEKKGLSATLIDSMERR